MKYLPNILIVDDNEENLVFLQSVMRKTPANLIVAMNGEEALEKSRDLELALAIIDVWMPGMNGYALANRMNEERQDIRVPIIFITASHINDSQISEAYGSGAVDYLQKPVNYHVLLCKINVFIDLFNQKQTLIRDAALLRRSAAMLDDTRTIIKKLEDVVLGAPESPPPGFTFPDDAVRKEIGHHLRKHEIHLKKQKEELNKAIVNAEVASENYARAYDFAPSGYFTLSVEKEIQETNQSGARMLEKKRERLINSHFNQFISPETEPVFNDFFCRVFRSKGKEECDVTLNTGTHQPKYVHIEGIITGNGMQCLINVVDITQHQKALESLQNEQLFSKSVIDSLPGIFYLYSYPELNLIRWNKNHELILGYTAEELKCLFLHDWVIPQAKELLVSTMRRVIEEGYQKIETVLYRKDGHAIPFILTGIHLQNNGKSYIMGVGTDITDRKKAEEDLNVLNMELEDRVEERTSELVKSNNSLQQAKEKFLTVANFTNDWEFWLDPQDRFLFCSPSCEKITGYTAAEFMRNPDLFYSIIYPKDLKNFQLKKQMLAMAQEPSLEIQYRIIRKDGTLRWIGHVTQPVYNDAGVFIGIRGSNRDITTRKNMENQLKTSNLKYQMLSENITDGIFICRSGRFEYVNNSMNRIFGYENQELDGFQLIRLVKPDHHDEVEKALDVFTPLDQIWELEMECMKKDGSAVFVEMILNRSSRDKVVYGVAHDITEKKQIQNDIVTAIIQTEEKERSNFSKELHDGLGPLLSAIKLYLQWSQRPKTDKSREEIIGKAEDILEEALTTVKEISNKLSPHLLTYYGLTSAIQSFVDKLHETSAIRVNLQSNAARRFDIKIEVALYRAAIECINNTIKHSAASNIFIDIDDAGSQLFLRYRDDGKGFNLAESFSAHKGLGLFNLQNRIQTIGGKINLNSKPNQGVDYQIIVNV